VNQLWTSAAPAGPAGLKVAGARPAASARSLIDAQVAFNSRQVQLDNQILEHLDARFDARTSLRRGPRHHGRHMRDIDERHVSSQEELVAHVHDLVQRIDLVLDRGRKNASVSRPRCGAAPALRAAANG